MTSIAVEVSERPILFSGEMVRANLRDVDPKTQTRRVMKPQPSHDQYHEHAGKVTYDGENRMWCWKDLVLENIWDFPDGNDRKKLAERCPYGKPGDRLWVRETFIAGKAVGGYAAGVDPDTNSDGPTVDVIYRADDGPNERTAGPWTPGIHMFRKYSRLTLEIKSVRVERVQDISEEDAKAEGVPPFVTVGSARDKEWYPEGYRANFKLTWDSINAKRDDGIYAWDKNPWIWVVEYKRLEAVHV